ncbi:hypothetical protein BH23PLA1_BH23PLA1_19020 [soil metagenome]
MMGKSAMPIAQRLRIAALVTFGLAISTISTQAQETDLPEAEAILDKYIEATGGAEAHQKIKTRVTRGTLEVVGAGLKGDVEIYQAAPAKLLSVVEFEGLGKIVQGTDGKAAWELNPLTGDRVLKDNEKADFLIAARLDETAWREDYEKVECTGVEDVDGKPAYKVVLTPKQGNPATNFYDKDSGLMVKSSRTVETPMGQIPVEIFISDYQEVDGLKIPFKSTQKVLTQELKTEAEEISHNVEIGDDRFAIPDSVKAMLDD